MRRFASPRLLAFFAGTVLLLLVGLDYALTYDAFDPAELALELAENVMLIGAMVVIALIASEMRALRVDQDVLRDDQSALRDDVHRAIAAGEDWRARSRSEIADFSAAIAREFEAWALTPAEAEIAGLMLKGMSLKQIAAARATSEATIRQQAGGIYRKSGLSGRAELAAYFLESLSPMPAVTSRSAAE